MSYFTASTLQKKKQVTKYNYWCSPPNKQVEDTYNLFSFNLNEKDY